MKDLQPIAGAAFALPLHWGLCISLVPLYATESEIQAAAISLVQTFSQNPESHLHGSLSIRAKTIAVISPPWA
jgi:hypothetical protein